MAWNKMGGFLGKKPKKNRIFIKSLLVFTLCLYFAFGSYRLTKFFTTDEHYWIHERILQYWQAVHHQEWEKTMINDKPGIALAYVSGIGLFWELHPDLYVEKIAKHVTKYDTDHTERLNLIFRLPILIFNGLFSFFFFWIIQKITGSDWIALWSAMLILLSPVLLGISRVVNPDSLLWVFSSASLFSFLAYLKLDKKKYATLSALFLGAAILSKYTAVILFPFFFAALIYKYLSNFHGWESQNKIKNNLGKLLAAYFAIIAASLIMFALLMPAIMFGKIFYYQKTIADIFSQLKTIFFIIVSVSALLLADAYFLKNFLTKFVFKWLEKSKKIWVRAVYFILAAVFIFVLINWITNQGIINLENIPFDTRRDSEFTDLPFYQKMILEFYPVVFSLPPLVILSLLYIWIKSLFKESRLNDVLFLLSSFVVIYYLAVIKNDLLATVRYSIMVYPLLISIAAVGIHDFWKSFAKGKARAYFLSIAIIITSITSLWKTSPFYFNYTNFLLPEKYLITGSWGEGGYEAAQHLNSLPNAENLTVWADYSGVCEFFKGTCIKLYDISDHNYLIDYYVLTRRGEIKYEPSRPRWRKPGYIDAYKYYGRNDPDWSLYINNRPGNFIKIFKADAEAS